MTRYKYCFVPRCKSTSSATPGKRFLSVPRANLKLREIWFAVCRGSNMKQRCESETVSANSVFHCCEDHFNESDYENLMQHRMMGTKLHLKPGVIPTKFNWREHRLRPKRKKTPSQANTVEKKRIFKNSIKGIESLVKSRSLPKQRCQKFQKTAPSELQKTVPSELQKMATSELQKREDKQNFDIAGNSSRSLAQQQTIPSGLKQVEAAQVLSPGNNAILVQQCNQSNYFILYQIIPQNVVLSTAGSSGIITLPWNQNIVNTSPVVLKAVDNQASLLPAVVLSTTANSVPLSQQGSQNISVPMLSEVKKEVVEEDEQILSVAENSISVTFQPSPNIEEATLPKLLEVDTITAKSSGSLTLQGSDNIQDTTPLELVEDGQALSIAESSMTVAKQRSQNTEKVPTLGNFDETSINRVRIRPKTLPSSFRNVIIEETRERVIIRSNINGMTDIRTWMSQFEDATYTKWNVRDTRPNGTRCVCRKRFVCHQSKHHKVEENSRSKSKNSDCNARITIVVKLTSPSTRKKDKYTKDGLPAIVTVDVQHSHSLDSAESLRFLPPSESTKERFIKYFNEGMGCKKSKQYHESYLMLRKDFTEKDLTCGRLNPKFRSVQSWYHKWKLEHRNAKKDKEVVEDLPQNSKSRTQAAKKKAALTEKLLSAMTCETFPVGEDNLETLAVEIKQEPLYSSSIIPSTAQNESKNHQSSAKKVRKSLLRPPVLIKQEIVSSDEEL